MGFTGDCCVVRCKLDDDELLCQLAEEAVELAMAILDCLDHWGTKHRIPEKWKDLLDGVAEELADVGLVWQIIGSADEMKLVNDAYEKESKQPYYKSPRMTAWRILWHCLRLAKAAMKLRRARNKKNPTPVSEDHARANILRAIGVVIPLGRIWMQFVGLENKVEDIKIRKAQRWAERLTGGMGDGRIHEDREGLLGK